MAAARCAARRLGGSLLQRAQAAATSPAVAEERRRLMPRRFHSDDKSNVATRRFYEECPESKIQQHKEKLYNLIYEADQQFLSEAKHRQLLQYLSEHVEPRPHDPEWRRLSFSGEGLHRGFLLLILLSGMQ
ncbi:hypothetical protein ACQ4PT_017263 [Festuca glaucescens]